MIHNKITKWILLVIVLLGFSLRVYGYNWGFPLLLHKDEWDIAEQAYLLTKNNTFEPTSFSRPNHLSIYTHAILYKLASPVFFHGQSLRDTFETNRPFYYGFSRIFTALVGTASIVIAFLIGLQFTNTAAITSAALFAIFPLYILYSHYITPDTTLTFMSLLTILFSLKYIVKKESKYIIALGIVSGISVAEKYPGIANLGLSGLIILIGNYRQFGVFLKKCVLLLTVFFASLFVVGPFLFIRFGKTVSTFKYVAEVDLYGMQNLGFLGNIKFYTNNFFTNSGLIISILAIIGLIVIIKKRKITYLPLILGFVYWFGLSGIKSHQVRWGLPMYTTPLLLSAITIDFFFVKLYNDWLRYLFIFFLLTPFFAQILLNKFNLTKLTAKNTRVIALEYLKENGITADNSIFEGYSALSTGSKGNTRYNLNELNNKKKEYVILSSSVYGKYLKEDKNGKYKKNIKFYNTVIKLKLVKAFKQKCPITTFYKSKIPEINNLFNKIDSKNCVVGPEIKIYGL